MKRENGFYWVKWNWEKGPEWEIAEYFPGRIGIPGTWYRTGDDVGFDDEDFFEINETRLIPPAN